MTDPIAPEAAAILKAAAAATTGPGTPDAATVTSKPPELALRMLAMAGPALTACVMWIAIAIAGAGLRVFWIPVVPAISWPAHVADVRLQGLVAIATILASILGIVTFRLASGSLRRAEVKVGPANIVVESGDGSA